MTKLIRKATPSDIAAVVKLGMEALNRDAYEGLVISEPKVLEMATECISSASHFCWVVEKDYKVVGAVSAMIGPMAFYERNQATVVQFSCDEPGEGLKLIREFMRWAKARRAIKMIVFTLECKADPRIGKLLERLGLDNELPVYMKVL